MVGEGGIAGAALIEFTIFAPLLVFMSIYTTDFGLRFFEKMEVQNAAQAGADWAIANRVYNSSAISTAVSYATTISTAPISVSSGYPKEQCGCPSSTGVTFTTYSGDTCPKCGSSAGGLYVTVQAQATFSSSLTSSTPYVYTAQSTARIQ